MALLRLNAIRVGVDRLLEIHVETLPNVERQAFVDAFNRMLEIELVCLYPEAHTSQVPTQQEADFWRTEDQIWTEHLLCDGREDYRYTGARHQMDMLEQDMRLLLEETAYLDEEN